MKSANSAEATFIMWRRRREIAKPVADVLIVVIGLRVKISMLLTQLFVARDCHFGGRLIKVKWSWNA